MVCLKNNDRVISDGIHSYGSWEGDRVMKVMRVMELYEDAVFIGKTKYVFGNDILIIVYYIIKMEVVILVCIQ